MKRNAVVGEAVVGLAVVGQAVVGQAVAGQAVVGQAVEVVAVQRLQRLLEEAALPPLSLHLHLLQYKFKCCG